MSDGIFLGLGSNIGDRSLFLTDAIRMLQVPILAASSVYESEPVDYKDQPWFLNQVIQIETEFTPMELLKHCQKIETQLGRKRDVSKGPRTIDIDLLFYNDQVMRLPELTLPHPGIAVRRFVLIPLQEIAPDLVHPQLHFMIQELIRRCPDRSEVRRIEHT